MQPSISYTKDNDSKEQLYYMIFNIRFKPLFKREVSMYPEK